ncbi:hypothetical protein [Streptomyces sp. NPDC005423]|uniref:hypothetical protein n=1 Tax=Streptomyces sp. NPDC005423 TaxID=3155343 RepID=UPI0033A6957A
MSEARPTTTDLQAHYAAQVSADLERNTAEQERIGAEVTALQEQLSALQHNQDLLAGLQQTLGGSTPPATGTGREDKATAAVTAEPRRTRGKKAAAGKPRKTTAKNTGAKASTAKAKQPTLVELIRTHLTEQAEPRSAAEITTALSQAHPERGIKSTVVRTTVEGLVAKSRVHRTKQGSSVYYTAMDTESADTSAKDSEH